MAANSALTSARGDQQYRSVPRIATLSQRVELAATVTGTQVNATFTPYTPITIVRYTAWATTAAATCSAAAVLSLNDIVSGSNIANVTFSNGINAVDAGLLSLNITASHGLIAEYTTAAGTCGTVPSGIGFVVEYK